MHYERMTGGTSGRPYTIRSTAMLIGRGAKEGENLSVGDDTIGGIHMRR